MSDPNSPLALAFGRAASYRNRGERPPAPVLLHEATAFLALGQAVREFAGVLFLRDEDIRVAECFDAAMNALASLSDALEDAYPDRRSPRNDTRHIAHRKWAAVLARDGFTCQNPSCGLRDETCQELQVDHIVPWSISHDSSLSNLQTLCTLCNLRKGAKLEWETA